MARFARTSTKFAEGDVTLDGEKEHLFLSAEPRPAGVTWGWLKDYYDGFVRSWYDLVDLESVVISGLIRVHAIDEEGNPFTYLMATAAPAPALSSLSQISNDDLDGEKEVQDESSSAPVGNDEEDPY